MLDFPNIDPTLIEIGPLAIRWYSLAYIFGIIFGALYINYLNNRRGTIKLNNFNPFDSFLTYSIIGIIIGGRLGYVLFYNFAYYINNFADIFKVWHGGMSFHGGFIGFSIAAYIFARKHNYKPLVLADLCASAAPIGLFFGRIANFINGELYGRITDSSLAWGMIFPNGGPLPRHPSQIYEAILEGLITFVILFILNKKESIYKKPGFITGLFIGCYGLSRFIVEFFREPDANLGEIIGILTMGQLLSIPMIILGLMLTWRSGLKNISYAQ